MERERQGKNLVIAVLLVTVVSMSVAFAALTNIQLNVNGTANLPDAQWDVKFTSVSVVDASDIQTVPTHTDNTVTYTIDLAENTSYEFKATITNGGTYDAKLNTLTVSDVPTDLSGLVTYTVSGISQNDVIAAGSTVELTVRVTMGTITSDALLTAVQNTEKLTFTVLAEYVQVSEAAA